MEKELEPSDALVVKEFVEIFPEKLLGLAPKREISFEIELIPGA